MILLNNSHFSVFCV